MLVKYNTLVNGIQSFQKINRMELPVRTAFKLSKFVRALDERLTEFDEARKNLTSTYQELAADPKKEPEAKEALATEMQALLDTEAELPDFQLLVTELDGQKLAPTDCANLEWLLDFTEPQPTENVDA